MNPPPQSPSSRLQNPELTTEAVQESSCSEGIGSERHYQNALDAAVMPQNEPLNHMLEGAPRVDEEESIVESKAFEEESSAVEGVFADEAGVGLPSNTHTPESNEIAIPASSTNESGLLRSLPTIINVPADDPCLGAEPTKFWENVENLIAQGGPKIEDDEWRASLAEKIENALPGFLGHHSQSSPESKFVKPSEWDNSTVWIIGDLHGDLLSFVTLNCYVNHIQSSAPHNDCKFRVVFLGDFVDDCPRDISLVPLILNHIVNDPASYFYLQGNHDVGVSYDETIKRFRSAVSPSDFCDRLNAMETGCAMHRLARSAIAFFQQAPAALLLPDGLLVAHGGVPHIDLQQHIEKERDLDKPEMVTDFVWTRLHESARRKVPNRTTRGCSLGFEDFNAFCDIVALVLGREISGMVRGHDHVPERFLVHSRYPRRPVVTINAMCRKQRGDVLGPYARKPVIARWRNNMPLEVHQLEIPEEVINRIYPMSYGQAAEVETSNSDQLIRDGST